MTGDLHLPSRPGTVAWGRLPARGYTPVASVRDGDVVVIDTVSHEGLLEDQGRDPARYFAGYGVERHEVLDDAVAIAASVDHDPTRHGPHVVTGPLEVVGARPGDVVEIETLGFARRVDYGVISNRHGRGALPGELPAADGGGDVPSVVSRFATARDDANGSTGRLIAPSGATATFPLAPFLGIMAVAVDAPDEPCSIPPGDHGGNLDIRHLGLGSRLFLPVQVPGAGLCVGDPHFSQGDGEVALTAFEGSLRATLRIRLHRDAAGGWTGPLGADADHWIVPGLHEDLNEAVRIATRKALRLLEPLGFDPATGLAYLSAAADLHVSQVVDGVKGVHFRIRRADLDDGRTLPMH